MSENNMSEINSIEELRIYADTFGFETRSKLNEIADNIELELFTKYVKLEGGEYEDDVLKTC